jgi:hypothetical protein
LGTHTHTPLPHSHPPPTLLPLDPHTLRLCCPFAPP